MRAAKCLLFMTAGYEKTAMDAIGHGLFEEDTNSDMVIVRDIEFHSLCEHHLVPFSGKVIVAIKRILLMAHRFTLDTNRQPKY